jgi:hypothetical protein
MSFDITKTETFVPFLWILLKTAVVLTIFSLFSENAHRTGSMGKDEAHTVGPMQFLDRLLTILLVSLVLCERGVDLYIVSRSDITQKVTRKTLTGLNTHIINDFFGGFCLQHYVRANGAQCTQSTWLLCTGGLWCVLGLAMFVFETHLKRRTLHHEQPRSDQESKTQGNMGRMVHFASPFVLYTSMVLLLAISLTSSCLLQIFNDMPSVQLCVRLLLYACYVCCRCYTQGMPGDSIIEEMPNIVLLGWIVLLPVLAVYAAILITVAAYARLLSTPSKKNTMLLPIVYNVAAVSALVHPVAQVQLPPAHAHENHQRSAADDNNAEFLAKLQNIEQSMQVLGAGSVSKSSHVAKRRQVPLF